MVAVGRNIRSLRVSKDMTQDGLAEKLFVSRQTVSNYETGKSHPDIDTLVKISEVLGTDVNALIYGIPVTPGRRKEFRKTAVATIVLLLLGIAAFILGSISHKWVTQYYILFPMYLQRTFLLPCFYILLGWDLLQIIGLFFGASPMRNRWIGRIRYLCYLTIAVLSLYVVAIAPFLITNFFNLIEIYHSLRAHIEYSQPAYHFLPVWDTMTIACIQIAIKYSIGFIIPGMAIWATKAKILH